MNQGSPFFSIICPFYNSFSFLEEAILSVVKQTFSSWELILVDDGSTDESLEIAKKYSSLNSKIMVFSIKNSGTFFARNYGLKNARGKYILFLDSDDCLENKALSILNSEITKHLLDIVIFNIRTFGPETIKKKEIIRIDEKKIINGTLNIINETFVKKEYGYGVCGCCFRNSLFSTSDHDVLFSNQFRSAEDILLAYFLFSKALSVMLMPDFLYNYRMNELSTTHTLKSKDYFDCANVFILIYSDICTKYKNFIELKCNNKIFWGCFSFIVNAPKLSNMNEYIRECRHLRNSQYYLYFIKKYKYASKKIDLLRLLLNARLYRIVYFYARYICK